MPGNNKFEAGSDASYRGETKEGENDRVSNE